MRIFRIPKILGTCISLDKTGQVVVNWGLYIRGSTGFVCSNWILSTVSELWEEWSGLIFGLNLRIGNKFLPSQWAYSQSGFYERNINLVDLYLGPVICEIKYDG